MNITDDINNLYNSQHKSNKLGNMYVRNFQVKANDGSWLTIQNKHIISCNWGNGMGRIGKVDLTIYSPDGVLYDFTKDGLWSGILNTYRREVRFTIKFPGIDHTVQQFNGYIEKAKKEAKGGQLNTINIYCLNKGMDLKQKAKPKKEDPEKPLAEVLPEFLNDNYSDYEHEEYTPDPSQFETVNEKWTYNFTFPNDLIYKTYYENTREYGKYTIYSKLTTGRIPNTPYLVINNGYKFSPGDSPTYNDDYVKHKLTIFNMETGHEEPIDFVSEEHYHKEHYMVCHPYKKMIGVFMPLYSRRTYFPDSADVPRYTWEGMRVYDLESKRVIYLQRDDDLFKDNPSELDDYKVSTATWGVDGHIYYITKNKRLWKGEIDFKKEKIKWYRIGQFNDLIVDREGLLESAEIFNRQKNILEILYLKGSSQEETNGYEIAVFYQGNYDGTPDERIPITGYINNKPFKAWYDGYYIMSSPNTSRFAPHEYTVVNQATGQADRVLIDNLPHTDKAAIDGRIEYLNRRLYILPAAKKEVSDQYHTYYTNLRTDFSQSEWQAKPSQFTVSEERSRKEVLDEIMENTNYEYYVDNVTGKLHTFFPNPKSEPDFVFEDGVNILSLQLEPQSTISGVEVLYGSGDNSQWFRIGTEPFTKFKLSGYTKMSDAVQFATRMLSRHYSYEGTLETLVIPELNVNDTILIRSPFAFNPNLHLKGVVVEFDWKDGNDTYGKGTIKFVAVVFEEE